MINENLFNELMLSIKEAGAIFKGELEPSRTFTYEVPTPEGIKAITD